MKNFFNKATACFSILVMIFVLGTASFAYADVASQLESLSKTGRFAVGTQWGGGACWKFADAVSKQLFGVGIPAGTGGKYYLTGAANNANWICVGSYNGSSATNDNIVALLKQAKPGDILQYRNSNTNPQHTSVVYAVNDYEISLYSHGGSNKAVRIVTKPWGTLCTTNGMGNFGGISGYGLSLYRCTQNAAAPCTSHVKGQYLWPEDAHPHYQYYTCANCGATFTDGSTTTMSNCQQCNCTSHVRGEWARTDSEHPHYQYYRCANCGKEFQDGTGTSNDCSVCNPPTITPGVGGGIGVGIGNGNLPTTPAQPEQPTQPEPVVEPTTPSGVIGGVGGLLAVQQPLTPPILSLERGTIKTGESVTLYWTSAGDGAEYMVNWSGTGGGSAWNIKDTYTTLSGNYFLSAGVYRFTVSASRDGQTVASGEMVLTVETRENYRIGVVTGTDGKNLAINDAPAASPNGSNKIGRIPPGARMIVYPDRMVGNWYWVDYNGVEGYAYSKYITLQ